MVKAKFTSSNLFDNIQRKADKLSEGQHVTLDELFNSSFMRKYTDFQSIDELFDKGGYAVASLEDIEKIIGPRFNAYISEHTKFSNWNEFQTKAVAEQVARQLGL
ncbi:MULTISPECIES: hypothetical protein [Paenibacillus]|uniref:hypothetical protein n=1 Tax=Paenibacillus TaxID=44249 RepID=UPI00096C03BF|nr:hypothetical protein [Paenibacillus odorifer]OME21598.1 hypothetical protein BSK57_19830 [Paenibacillus odorifer]